MFYQSPYYKSHWKMYLLCCKNALMKELKALRN